jgi:hypothetical protein
MIKLTPSLNTIYKFFGADGAVSIMISDYIIQNHSEDSEFVKFLEKYAASLQQMEKEYINLNRHLLIKFFVGRLRNMDYHTQTHYHVNNTNILNKCKLNQIILSNDLTVAHNSAEVMYGDLNNSVILK